MCTLISTPRKWLGVVAAIGLLVSLIIPATLHAQTLPVTTAGATRASYDVTPNGQARYTVPLWTPPGIRGIEPRLALIYGSDVRSATLGHGWTLGGLSKLTRCGRTYAQHGAPDAVTLTMTDRFCLDGQMLRITAGTYGAADSQYQTEFADFSLVIARSALGNGPAWFEVKTRDGLILEYGNSGDSRALLPNSSTPYVWALNKIRDRDGNNLKVTYSPLSGTLVPSLIEYTQTPLDTSYPYAVVFNYGTRTPSEVETGYVAGLTYSETRLLTSIDMRHGGPSGTLQRKYRLFYSNLSVARRRQLSVIQECAGTSGTDCKQDTHFTYTSGGAGVITTGTSAGTLPTGGRIFNADLNGDGRGDLVYEQGTGASNQWFVRFGSASGFAAAVSTGIVGTSDVLMNDFLGTGQEDLLAPAGGVWHRYRWNGSSFVATSIGLAIDPAVMRVPNGGDYPPPSFASADMDGDGLPDLVWAALYNNSPALWMRRNTSFGTTVRFSGNMVHAFSLPVAPVQFFGLYGAHSSMLSDVPRMDFNGDQREDMVVVTFGTAGLDDFTARELVSLGETFAAGPTITNFSLGPAPVNWNDDACTDLAHGMRVHISACNATAGQPVDTQKLGFLYMDWNADGRTDSLTMGSTNMEVIYSEGGSAAAPAATTLPATFGGFFIVDFDGDAQSDLVFRDFNNGAFRFHRHLGANSPPGLMLGAFTDDGSSWQPGWTSIVQGNYAPNDGSLPVTPFPLIQFTGPVYVVKHYLAGGSDYNFRADFFYWSARKDLRGHSFAGFGRRRMLDSRTGFYSYEEYKERHPWLGQIARQRLLQADNVTPVFERTNNWLASFLNLDFANSRVLTYVGSSEHKRYEVGGPSNGALIATHTYAQQLDDWGTEIYSRVTFSENATGAQPGAQLSFGRNYDTIVNDTANWCLGRPGRVRDSGNHNLPGGDHKERITDYSWDYVKCRPTSEIVEPGSAKWQVTRDYRYDSVGNIDRVTETPASGQGQTARVTSLNYGTTGQFLRSVTDAKSFVTQLEWDAAKSVQTKITDPNGLITQWEYDNFGRRTKEIRPDGTRTEFALRNCDDGNGYCDFVDDFGTAFAYESIATLRDANNLLVRTDSQVFDSRDLMLATRSQLLTGATSTQVSFIDSYGRVMSRYVPYTTARMPSGQARTTFTYDAVGRLTLIRRPMSDTDPSDNDTRFSYSGLTETQTDALNRVTTRVRDVAGRIVRVTDANNQSTEYGYDALGNLIRTRDPLGAERSMTFTSRGLKLSADDPDMGLWTYDYFPFQELKSKTDAKNQTITFTYDELSRVLTETMPEGTGSITHTFAYGSSSAAKNIGQLHSMQTSGTGLTTYKETYAYDGVGRLSQTTYTEGTTTNYLVDYAYNPAGLLSKVTYPVSTAGFRLPIEYEYSRGVLSRVFDSVNQFWVANQVDARGHVTDAVVGEVTAGVTFQTLSSYDAVTGALESRQSTFNSGAVSGTPLANISLLYDAVGNVIQRQDNQRGLTENFYYDALNRLDYSTLGAATVNYSYDARGNITEKTGVGTLYSYTANVAGCSYYFHTQIHAVRRITGGSSTMNFCYDANGNMTNRNGTSLTWFASNLPKAITKDANNSSTFEYTPTGRRWRHTYRTGGANYTHTYIGPLVEKVVGPTSTAWKHYIYAGAELVSMYVRRTDGFKKRHFFAKDHLGSVETITREDGTLVVRESFAAFGSRRAPNWTGTPSSAELAQMNETSRKGFTGHEHLDSTGFIHMNGRVYDPLIGRFASADPHVQAPFDPQSLNRFSYVRNNPLRFVDPSGFFGMCPDCDIGPPGPFWDIDVPFLPPDIVFCIVTGSCDQPQPGPPPSCGLRRCRPPPPPQPPPPQLPGPEAPAADEFPLATAATLASENVATLAWFKENVRGQDVEPALGGEQPRILIASLGPVVLPVLSRVGPIIEPVVVRPIPQTTVAQAVSRAVRPQPEVPSPGPGPVANPTGSPAANPKPTAADLLKQTESLNQNTKPEMPVNPNPPPPLPRMGDTTGPLPTTKWGAIVQILGRILEIMIGGGGTGRPGPFTTGPVFEIPEEAPPFDWDECIKANMCT
jgi:RHS repeat-associated protein